MSLESKIRQNIVDRVSAGEVCSIETAKKLGIFDKDNYYQPKYNSVKTYNTAVDARENRNSFKLCTVNNLNNAGYPLCTLTPNAGIGFTTKSGYNKCITSECPPGFEEDEDNPTECKKPIVYRTYSLQERNDERWYDWFTVPNYHLGNKFSSSNNINYVPCKDNLVPNYAIDPVDNSSKDWTSKDELDKCIDKNTYFAGKYANTANYCPISLVKQMGSSRQDLVNNYLTLANTENLTQSQLRELVAIEKVIKTNKISNIDFPTTEMTQACSTINTNKRLEEAYQICDQLNTNEEAFMAKFTNESDSLRNVRSAVTKFSCHNLFCQNEDSNENNAARIDKDPICFGDIAKLKLEDTIRKYQEESQIKNKEQPVISSDSSKQEFLKRAKGIIFTMAFWLIVVLLGYLMYKYAGKFLKRIYYPLICKFFNIFRGYNAAKCKTWDIIANEELQEELKEKSGKQIKRAETKQQLEGDGK